MKTVQVQVLVAGEMASGKSCIAFAIAQALREHGIEVILTDDNGIGIVDEAPGVMKTTWRERIATFAADGNKVLISTRQLRRAMRP